ncbi:MAG: hypothetical protein L3J39_05280 [Verrucomicrobiales bacterium]|nr:hypothetical protein [Verrucomicrobiales bacterium]
MIDKTHFRIPTATTENLHASPVPPPSGERLEDVEKRLALFEELLFDCAMTLKDKVSDRLDQLEDLCHHQTAQLRQEQQQSEQDRKKQLNLLTLKISEAIDRVAAEKKRASQSETVEASRFEKVNKLPANRQNNN